MGKVTMEGVQELLHLDVQYPNFSTWKEVLDFEVDGVAVKAIATHAWREDTVRIVEPFEVEGSEYLYGFPPPLIALGAAMLGRQRSLQARGLTVHDDCIRMATGTYREHATRLRLKPEIEREQEAFASVFREELDALSQDNARAQAHFMTEKAELHRKLRSQEIEPKPYAAALSALQKSAKQCELKHHSLKHDVDFELKEIEREIISRALTASDAEPVALLRMKKS